MTDGPDLSATSLERLGLGVREPQRRDRDALGQQEFFELMVAQLTNQDPIKPLDSQDFLAQVAQFSQVNGIQSIEQSISRLATSMESNQALQASTLVGRDVLVPANVVALDPGQPVRGAIDLLASTSSLVVEIATPAGAVVRHLALGQQQAGQVAFTWDGLDDDGGAAPAGNYVVAARASIDGAEQGVPVLASARVDSVTINRNPSGVTLNLEGIGPTDIGAVREFL